MTIWGFRFKFLVAKKQRIDYESDSLEILLPPNDLKIHLKSPDRVALTESDNLVISGSGFSTKKDAESCGLRIKKSILLCGPFLRMGFDVGKDKASFFLGKNFKEEVRELGYQIIDDVHGLYVYEECMPLRVFGGGSTLIIGVPVNKFISDFRNIYKQNPRLSEKQTLALELYNISYFESSHRARFLTLISAVECLSYQDKRSLASVEHIDNLIKITKDSTLTTYDKKLLLNNLNNLKKESISESCKKLINNHLSAEEATKFNKFYKIRSQIIHKGVPSKDINLSSEINELENFVSKLLKSAIFNNINNTYNHAFHSQRHIEERKIIY